MERFKLLYQSVLLKYKVELIFLFIALILSIFSLSLLVTSELPTPKDLNVTEDATTASTVSLDKITVDIQGAVKNPDAYTLDSGARLKDILALAGGLTSEADTGYFGRQFNLAQKLSDEQKFYIPTKKDVASGLFSQVDANTSLIGQEEGTNGKINLNTASANELDSLPGVGTVTAEKILTNRPYSNIDELLGKNVLNSSTFDKIKDLVTAI